MTVAGVEKKRSMTTATKTFRGRTLEEVLPQIKADLGPDAEIIRQREGLTGGVGGFFQRACVEVDARPGDPEPPRRRFDAYDDEPAMPEPLSDPMADPMPEFEPDPLPDESMAEGLEAPGIQEIFRQAAPFANHLTHALEPAPAPIEPIERALVDAGLGAGRAHEIVAETVSHLVPFASRRQLRKLVRQALARRIPVAPPPAAGGRSLAFAGPAGAGKTLCSPPLAVASAGGGDLPVVCVTLSPADGGNELRALVEPHGVGVTVARTAAQARAHIAGALGEAVVVVDTPSALSEADLGTLALDELHLTLPSTYSAAAAADFAERVPATHIALTHLDETTRVGGLVDFLIDAGRPLSYVSRGDGVLAPADANDIAGLVLP